MNLLGKTIALIGILVCSTGSLAGAAEDTADVETLLKTCQAATWDEQHAKLAEEKAAKNSKRGPLRRAVRSVAKGVGSELSASAQGIGRDMVLVMSVQDVDPYAGSAPTNKPYELASFRLVDGTMCKLIKYPDRSGKVNGGFADGTIVAPMGGNKFVVGYPNGTRATLVKSGDQIKVYRPDKTVSTFDKSASGNYRIHNSSLGYMGEGITDQTGLRFDFGSFGAGTF